MMEDDIISAMFSCVSLPLCSLPVCFSLFSHSLVTLLSSLFLFLSLSPYLDLMSLFLEAEPVVANLDTILTGRESGEGELATERHRRVRLRCFSLVSV
jgi:hypothetical protein